MLEIEDLHRKELRGCQFLWQLRLCRPRASLLFSENTRRSSNTDRVVVLEKGIIKFVVLFFFTLKRSKLFFLSLGLRSPWRQTQDNWWPLLSGPEEKRPIAKEDSEFISLSNRLCHHSFICMRVCACNGTFPLLKLPSVDA